SLRPVASTGLPMRRRACRSCRIDRSRGPGRGAATLSAGAHGATDGPEWSIGSVVASAQLCGGAVLKCYGSRAQRRRYMRRFLVIGVLAGSLVAMPALAQNQGGDN